MSIPIGRRLAALVPIALFAASHALAAPRTFVSTGGSDSNACTLTAPCRGFTKALTVTDAGGEVVALDSGGYGAVTVGKPASLIAPPGVYAGISVFAGGPTAGQGVVVDPGAGVVTLIGLTINNQTGTNGIALQSGDALYLDNVVVTGFASGHGLIASVGAEIVELFIQDSIFRDSAVGLRTGTTTGALALVVERTLFERNGTGAVIQGSVRGAIHGTTFSGGVTGVAADPAGAGAVQLDLRSCIVSGNSGSGIAAIAASPTRLSVVSSQVSGNQTGVQVSNGGNVAYVSDSMITRNATGLSASAGGSIASGIDNRLINNTTNGTFSLSVPKL